MKKVLIISLIIIVLVIFLGALYFSVPEGGRGEEPWRSCFPWLVRVGDIIPLDSECLPADCPCFICTKCGDGICGKGENKCNCPKDCKDNSPTDSTTIQSVDSPYINSIFPSSGSKGTMVEIKGKNLSGLEGDLNVYFERPDGKIIVLVDTFGDYPKTGGNLIKVKVLEPCQQGEVVTGEYSGIKSVCDYVELTPGMYKVYASPWGVKSNIVNFEITK